MTPTNPTTSIGDAAAPERPGAHPRVRRVFLAGTASVSAFVTVVAAIVMGTFVYRIGTTFESIDVDDLKFLKG